METLVWILQVVPHAIFITGLIVAGHWAIKKIIKAVKEYDVFVEAKTQDEAEKAATRDSVVSKPGFADTIEYYADEIYNADSTVDKSDIEIIKAEDVL